MAKKNNLYTVGYEKDGELTVIFDVDLFDLPYDEFNEQSPLWILNNVNMGKGKNRTWPNFKNVNIYGSLDCSDFPITPDTVLPESFDTLICKHSISDLDVLINLLPDNFVTLPTPHIIVRPAILNNIKNNKGDALSIAKRFAEKYPNVIVTDTKQKLSEILTTIDKTTEKRPPTPKKEQQTTHKNTPEQKTDEWLSTDETAEHIIAQSTEISTLPYKKVLRYIQMARSTKSNLKIQTKKLLRTDGAKVSCIHISETPRIIAFIQESVAAHAKTKEKKEKPITTPKTPQPTTDTQKKYFVNQNEITETKIEKYISPQAFGDIKTKCGNNTTDLLRILNDINVINVNPADNPGKQVLYIQDSELKVSPTVKFKHARCLCQGFGTLDNRPRIVWGVSGNYFICQKFFARHNTTEYNEYFRALNIDASKLDLSEYLYVPKLIDQLTGGKPAPSDTTPEQTPPNNTASIPDTTPTNTDAPKTQKWSQLYSLNTKYQERLNLLNASQSKLILQLTQETETNSLLNTLQNLQSVLLQKQKCEQALQRIQDMNNELKQMQQALNKQK